MSGYFERKRADTTGIVIDARALFIKRNSADASFSTSGWKIIAIRNTLFVN